MVIGANNVFEVGCRILYPKNTKLKLTGEETCIRPPKSNTLFIVVWTLISTLGLRIHKFQ